MFTTILVPLDESPLARRVVPYAQYLAEIGGGRLILLRAVSERALARDENAEVDAVLEDDALAEVLRQRGAEVTSQVTYGRPAPAIVRAATELGADLIAMATHGRGGLSRVIHRSVAEEVLRQARRPVLLITPGCERQWDRQGTFRILVPLDGSAFAEEALPPTLELAESTGAEVCLLRVAEERWDIDALGFGRTVPVSAADLEEAQEYLDRVAAQMHLAGLNARVQVVSGPPERRIAGLVAEAKIDLIVMATHGRGSLGSLLLEHVATAAMAGRVRLGLGSVASVVLQQLTVPIVLVRPMRVGEPRTMSESRQAVEG